MKKQQHDNNETASSAPVPFNRRQPMEEADDDVSMERQTQQQHPPSPTAVPKPQHNDSRHSSFSKKSQDYAIEVFPDTTSRTNMIPTTSNNTTANRNKNFTPKDIIKKDLNAQPETFPDTTNSFNARACAGVGNSLPEKSNEKSKAAHVTQQQPSIFPETSSGVVSGTNRQGHKKERNNNNSWEVEETYEEDRIDYNGAVAEEDSHQYQGAFMFGNTSTDHGSPSLYYDDEYPTTSNNNNPNNVEPQTEAELPITADLVDDRTIQNAEIITSDINLREIQERLHALEMGAHINQQEQDQDEEVTSKECHCKRRNVIIGALCIIIITAIVVGVIISLNGSETSQQPNVSTTMEPTADKQTFPTPSTKEPTPIPTTVPTPMPAMAEPTQKPTFPLPSPTSIDDQLIIDRITTLVGEKYLSQDWTPHSKALNWLLFDDPASLGPSSANLIQRYVLALFYFATTESEKWLSCNPTFVEDDAENLSSSCTFKLLDDVYPQLTYVDVESYRWLSDRSECNWSGIFCESNGDVRGIELFGQEIQSTLPKELALLPQLQSIGLQWNSFYGALPAEFASMRNLVTLDLHYNMFSGEIPREWFISSDSSTNWQIQSLNLAGNELSGNLPPTISNLKLLKGLFLYENQLTGSLPSEIGEMDHLAYIRLTRNNMVGSIPSEIGKLTGLYELWLDSNSLSGSIPSEIGNMRSLNDLRLNYNRLNGELPEELYNLENLYRLDLYNCKFSGSISSAIGNLKHLESLRIRSNDFTGSLPSEIGLLTHVDEIWMNNNDMTGSIPQEVCELRSNIGLIVLDADCPDKIDCDDDCCTGCCLENGLSICESERK